MNRLQALRALIIEPPPTRAIWARGIQTEPT
jgi:hypothetical protein